MKQALKVSNIPGVFSLISAHCLAELCARAESSDEPWQVEESGGATLVAVRGFGDASEILNLRGATDVDGLKFGNGVVYGPLARQYRMSSGSPITRIALDRPVWLSGHGLGGAFAVLAAAELHDKGAEVAAVYTFGAPRVGDRSFVRALQFPVFRVVNNLDVMESMPPPWKWRHAGAHKLINADGTLNTHPNPINRLPSLLRQTAWLGEMLAQGLTSGFPRALNTLQTQVWGDHALDEYCERLRALSE